jgi:DNA repair protein SbcC/Rad50
MNQIKLSKMELRNFKGVKGFTLNIGGQIASIFGENGKGKTTLYDAFLWVLFGKDSANRADFSVKPQDPSGKDIHYLETDITIEFLINGQSKTLRKMLKEKWTRKRGTSTDEFSGHETSYWVDTVPVKAKEYADVINSIINETAFKLLTNPFYFCTQLTWQDRRKTLMEICGDVSDEDVIASDQSFSELTNILNGKSINDQRKIITEKIKMLNSQIEEIPVKINELSRTVLGEEINYSVVEAGLLEHKASLRKIEQSMTDTSQLASEYRRKQQEAFKLGNAIEERKKELDAETGAGSRLLTDEKAKLENEKYRLETITLLTKSKIKDKESVLAENEAKLVTLRETWTTENAKQFVDPDPNVFVCPTCGQDLPTDRIEHRIKEMRESFEHSKAQAMDKARSEGKAIGAKQKTLADEIESLKTNLMNDELKMTEIDERLTELNKEIEAGQKHFGSANYEADEKYQLLKSQYQTILDELNKPVEDTTSDPLQQKAKITEQIETLNKLLNTKEVAMKTKARIEELKEEERTLANQLSDFEKQKYLIEQFIKAKVNLLEGNINSRFKIVKWKLFDVQINGGISECCEAMVDGVTYPNVNHAGKVNAGLDIINVLAGHYGCTAPIWIDFRESVSRIIDTQSQVINLIKSEPDKTLRVEVSN